MSTSKYEKHQRSRAKKWVLTEPDGEQYMFDTQEELRAFYFKMRAAESAQAAPPAPPPQPPVYPPPV